MMPRARNPACTNLAETERLFRSIPRRPEPEGRRRPTKFTSPCWTRADFAIEIEKASNRQFHAKLFALAVAQDRQVHEFAGLAFSMACPKSMTSRVRCPSTAMISSCDWPIPLCSRAITPSIAGGKNSEPARIPTVRAV
jgi:hypothetical protein